MNRRRACIILFSTGAIIVLAITLLQPRGPTLSPESDRAIIVDGLLGFPNQTFLDEARKILTDAGLELDVVEPDNVTVDLFNSLPSGGYDLIVLRVHCGPLRKELSGGGYVPEGTAFFTTELYSPDKHEELQNRGVLAVGRIRGDEVNRYFAIPPWFFEAMESDFVNSSIVLNSCYGFWSDAPLVMAETLRQRGVIMFIGWDGEVQADHTDAAIVELLRNLYSEGLSVDESVKRVMDKMGPDPYYMSKLYYYPVGSGDLALKK